MAQVAIVTIRVEDYEANVFTSHVIVSISSVALSSDYFFVVVVKRSFPQAFQKVEVSFE